MKKDTMYIVLAFAIVLGGYTLFYMSSRGVIQESFAQFTSYADKNSYDYKTINSDVITRNGAIEMSRGQTKEVDLTPVEVPYTQEPINDLDDYESNVVYMNESDKALSKELKNKLMSQRPMEWSGLPPSSSQFQAGLRESFENAKQTVPDNAKPYKNIDGDLMQPPDLSEAERVEKKILQTYKPKFPPTPTSYDPRDAQELITQIYDAKGLIPQVKHKDGTNVYEIIGVRKKNEKVMFEDEEGEVTDGPNKASLESTINPPQVATDMSRQSKDPFFDPGTQAVQTKGRTNKWNYTSWTPGLERMFAPTEEQQQWY
jgi:hypothetical protein